MELFEIPTKIVHPGDDLAVTALEAINKRNIKIEEGDVLAISSKIVATAEHRTRKLSSVKPSKKTEKIAARFGLEPRFAEIVLQQADKVYWGVPGALLTLKEGILTPNAGVDQKNAPEGHVALWPKDPNKTAEKVRQGILERIGKRIGVLIIDSRITPLRLGTTGVAIGLAGFEPIRDCRTRPDIYGRRILITKHALADDLASAAHLVIGESNEQTPLVLIKNAPIKLTERIDTSSTVIPRKYCLFASHMKPKRI